MVDAQALEYCPLLHLTPMHYIFLYTHALSCMICGPQSDAACITLSVFGALVRLLL